MVSAVTAFDQVAAEAAKSGLPGEGARKIAGELAKAFSVREDEVGILRLEKQRLAFVYPSNLQNVGTIPLNTSGSVAARTATTKRAEIINNFAGARHATVFEAAAKASAAAQGEDKGRATIQKLMSAPVVGPGGTLGVVQVCRKGATTQDAGADFTPSDLQKLTAVCNALVACFQ